LSIEIGTMTAAKLSVSGLVVSTSAWAQSAISKIDAAINTVSTERADLERTEQIGAYNKEP